MTIFIMTTLNTKAVFKQILQKKKKIVTLCPQEHCHKGRDEQENTLTVIWVLVSILMCFSQ